MTSRHVLVLSGGLSPERDVSLRSGRRVADALRDVRPDWHVAEADVDAALLPYLQQNRQTASCPCCTVPPVRTVRYETFSKPSISTTWAPTRRGVVWHSTNQSPQRWSPGPGLPSRNSSSCRNRHSESWAHPRSWQLSETASVFPSSLSPRVVVVHSASRSCVTVRTFHAMVSAFAYGETVMIQRFISGTEIAVSVDGRRCPCPPAVEIVPESGMYDYHARHRRHPEFFVLPVEWEMAAPSARLTVHSVLD